MSHLAVTQKPTLPLILKVDPKIDPEIVEALKLAADEWNKIRPCFVVVTSETQGYNVVDSERTWVNMFNKVLHIGRSDAVSFVKYWVKHELGHLLCFGDHIRKETNPTGYINPEICSWPDDEYQGIMSYCYYNNEITDQDRAMVLREYPLNLQRRVRIPGVARD